MALTRRAFLKSSAGTAIHLAIPARWPNQQAAEHATGVRIQLIRHATCLIHYGGKKLLLDPMFSDVGVLPAIARTPNPRPNPLVPLPTDAADLLTGVDATLVTHTHFDHWDTPARDLLRKEGTIFVQPPDKARFADAGFTDIRAFDLSASWEGIEITRTGAQHGRGETAQRMGPVSGYVLRRSGSPTVYIAGDSVWCPEVVEAIRSHRPNVIIVNAGAAQFLEGGPITMDSEDVVNVCRAAPNAVVIATHMEAINHCVLSREALRDDLSRMTPNSMILIPRDGEDMVIA